MKKTEGLFVQSRNPTVLRKTRNSLSPTDSSLRREPKTISCDYDFKLQIIFYCLPISGGRFLLKQKAND